MDYIKNIAAQSNLNYCRRTFKCLVRQLTVASFRQLGLFFYMDVPQYTAPQMSNCQSTELLTSTY